MTVQLFSFPFAMSLFTAVTINICKCHLPQINVDKIVCVRSPFIAKRHTD